MNRRIPIAALAFLLPLAACVLTPAGLQFLELHFSLSKTLAAGDETLIHQQAFPATVVLKKYFVRISGRISGASSLPDRVDLLIASEAVDDGKAIGSFNLKIDVEPDGTFSATKKWGKNIAAGTLQSFLITPIGADLAGDLEIDVCVHVIKKKAALAAVADCAIPVGAPEDSSGGVVLLVAANDSRSSGFHELLNLTGTHPADLGPTAGRQLVVALQDVSRPSMVCEFNHHTSGCATVDWDDFAGQRNVPPSRYFTNRLTVQTTTGVREFYLTQDLTLEGELDDDFAVG